MCDTKQKVYFSYKMVTNLDLKPDVTDVMAIFVVQTLTAVYPP